MPKLYTYNGKGQLYVAIKGSGRFVPLCNIEKLAFTPQMKDEELLNNQTLAGGQLDVVTEVTGVEIAIGGISQYSPDVLSLLLKGASTNVAAGTATETVKIYRNCLAPVSKPIDWSKPVTVKASAGAKGTVKDLTEGTHWMRSGAGIRVLDVAALLDGDPVDIQYTSLAISQTEALTTPNVEVELQFEGLNAADSGNPVIVRAYRCRLGAGGLDLLQSDGFSKSDLSGKLMMDPNRVGVGLSQFFTVMQVQ
ncbi:hypothetical protein JFK97_10940 [Chromobacterium phragmitis]|uniref:phage tail tube protein n=1 Tax=Chromobacterium amazonense TaxID=1382803 RepID=UPI0021B7F1C1|nr:hypothetical protein [Chromobacterium amazonense]MBM2884903.1 hypothetical protein [Chromobacterium amazonense]MDE1714750.1 hypothetical protein [Chromobacterium amazonense]